MDATQSLSIKTSLFVVEGNGLGGLAVLLLLAALVAAGVALRWWNLPKP